MRGGVTTSVIGIIHFIRLYVGTYRLAVADVVREWLVLE